MEFYTSPWYTMTKIKKITNENGAEEHREVEQVPYERADRHAEVGERREQDCEQRAVQEVVLFDAVRVFPFPEIERAVLERKKVVLFAVRYFQQR